MFIFSRVVNGIVTLFCSIVLWRMGRMAFPEGLDSSSVLALSVLVLFLSDLVFRKKDSPNSSWFTGIWVLVYLYPLSIFLTALFDSHSTLYDPAFPVSRQAYVLVTFALWGFPLLTNGIYLTRQLTKKKTAG
jgi:hypothetical protein